jgi:hypothetical protein
MFDKLREEGMTEAQIANGSGWNESCGPLDENENVKEGYPGCGGGGNIAESRQPLMCEGCPNVVHNRATCLGAQPINKAEEDFWCLECVEKEAAEFHVMGCATCNVREHVSGEIIRLFTWLGDLGLDSSADVIRWMLPRARKFVHNLVDMAAHKIQDAHMKVGPKGLRTTHSSIC